MKINKIKEMSSPDLEKELGELKSELFKLRFTKKANGLDNPMKIKEVKKDIARIKTILNERKLNEAKNKKAYGEKIEKLASMNWATLRQFLMSAGLSEEEVEQAMDSNSQLSKLISEYQNLKSESTEFKNKQFTQHQYEYDDYYNGTRVKKIIFKEQGL